MKWKTTTERNSHFLRRKGFMKLRTKGDVDYARCEKSHGVISQGLSDDTTEIHL